MSLPALSPVRAVGARTDVPVVGATSDEELARRLLAGDPWARVALYRRHFRVVFVTALRLLASRAEAEDVVQDSFLAAFRDIGAIREPSAIGGWRLKITVRQVHHRLQRRRLLRTLGMDRGMEDGALELLRPRTPAPKCGSNSATSTESSASSRPRSGKRRSGRSPPGRGRSQRPLGQALATPTASPDGAMIP